MHHLLLLMKKRETLVHIGPHLLVKNTSFMLPSGGEEIKGDPLIYIPALVAKVVQLLEENER